MNHFPSLTAWILTGAILVAVFVIEAIVRSIVQPGHAAFAIRTQATRTGQAVAIVSGIVLWNAYSAAHGLPEWWFLAALVAGSVLLGAIPAVAAMIWKSRQAQQ